MLLREELVSHFIINTLHYKFICRCNCYYFLGADIFLRLIQLMQDNSPERLKRVYVINGKYSINIMYKMFIF